MVSNKQDRKEKQTMNLWKSLTVKDFLSLILQLLSMHDPGVSKIINRFIFQQDESSHICLMIISIGHKPALGLFPIIRMFLKMFDQNMMT
jgi:hypothetical protein